MLRAGDVATVLFLGANTTKRRPVVVISSDEYNGQRPDVVVAVLTSNLNSAITPFDYILRDWAHAGLRLPSAFRCYLQTDLQSEVSRIGSLTKHDWEEVQLRLRKLIGG